MNVPGKPLVFSLVALLPVLAAGCGGDVPASDSVDVDNPEPQPPAWIVETAIYSDPQADRGADLFVANCTACHLLSDFTEPPFHRGWGGNTVEALFRFVSGSMPRDAPGRLELDEYAAILAFFFRENRLPAGADELGTDLADLREIRLERRDAGLRSDIPLLVPVSDP